MKTKVHYADLYDMSDGVNIETKKIDQWIDEIVEKLQAKILSGDKFLAENISSGNTVVCGFAYLQENGNYTFDIYVSKQYKVALISDVHVIAL